MTVVLTDEEAVWARECIALAEDVPKETKPILDALVERINEQLPLKMQ